VKKEGAYVDVAGNSSGSRPKELFEDAVEEADRAYETARAALKEVVRDADIAVELTTTFDAFKEALSEVGGKALEKVSETSRCGLTQQQRPASIVAETEKHPGGSAFGMEPVIPLL
jgi:hypothetical protein